LREIVAVAFGMNLTPFQFVLGHHNGALRGQQGSKLGALQLREGKRRACEKTFCGGHTAQYLRCGLWVIRADGQGAQRGQGELKKFAAAQRAKASSAEQVALRDIVASSRFSRAQERGARLKRRSL
jgi:hypothetical protein